MRLCPDKNIEIEICSKNRIKEKQCSIRYGENTAQVAEMTYLWGGMLLLGILYGGLTGNLQEVTEAVVSSAEEAVSLCIAMAGITAMWTGIMKIAENTGLVSQLAEKMRPVLKFLFPRLEPDSPAGHYISLNFLSNLFGISWASTSAGLSAMKELAVLEEKRKKEKTARGKGEQLRTPPAASREMCTFLIINVSSLQLIPVNIIACRAKYGSVDPTAVVGPAILATAVSTAVAVIFCKIMDHRKGDS